MNAERAVPSCRWNSPALASIIYNAFALKVCIKCGQQSVSGAGKRESKEHFYAPAQRKEAGRRAFVRNLLLESSLRKRFAGESAGLLKRTASTSLKSA
ncbi:hypothetical protein [Aneurinibacillus soli]|uniref:hypothetical protein n=1 Tax=Aneurinibacillus soli TaxID=1500254 RepID=UPI000BBA6277|nr:hypothetical protein [Aneurinibacillus soli]